MAQGANSEPSRILPGTRQLDTQEDLASVIVDGVDRFLLKQIDTLPGQRRAHWPKLAEAKSVEKETPAKLAEQWKAASGDLRKELAALDGMRDQRMATPKLTIELAPSRAAGLPGTNGWVAAPARWNIFEGVDAEGVWVAPSQVDPLFSAIVVPDADQMPEQMIGIASDANAPMPLASMLAQMGGEVLVPTPIGRTREARRGRATMTDQEFLYRSAFELGRHPLGYQLHEVLAAAEILHSRAPQRPVLIFGWGEGGWIALHAAALSETVTATCVSGYFQARESLWREPIHRNQHGLLLRFGDAELAALSAPRGLVIDMARGPQVTIAGDGGAPGELPSPEEASTRAEFTRAKELLASWQLGASLHLIEPSPKVKTSAGPSSEALKKTLEIAGVEAKLEDVSPLGKELTAQFPRADQRRNSTLRKWDRFNQRLLETAADERSQYWKGLDTSSPEKFVSSVEVYRERFAKDVIGRWDIPLLPANPRTRLLYNTPEYVGYEVVLDVFEDVIAYGILLLPKNQPQNEKRPCVVFQHGLEGRPQDCIVGDHAAYHDVAAQLAKRGFVVFAPQNLYLFKDRFRTLQRKSNPMGRTLFSIIVPQHQQIVNWLTQQPQIDPDRVAFYGLSYGGKSAMRIPPLVPKYCLSICSADFNDWVWKNASTTSNYSYVWTMEYEIFEWDLGSRFNYAEMATLIAPRPFMVERGHFDGVAPDERVGLEYAKVQHLYSAKLKRPSDTRIEWFAGPHTINGQGTFDFLHEKLKFPKP